VTDLLTATEDSIVGTIVVIGNSHTESIDTAIIGTSHSVNTFRSILTRLTIIGLFVTDQAQLKAGISRRHTVIFEIAHLGPITENPVFQAIIMVGQVFTNTGATGVIATVDSVITIIVGRTGATFTGSLITD
jgi:hypothetical protein